MPSALQRKRGRHKPVCAASRLRLQAMASLARAEFCQQYILGAAETCHQTVRVGIGARRSVWGQSRSVAEWAGSHFWPGRNLPPDLLCHKKRSSHAGFDKALIQNGEAVSRFRLMEATLIFHKVFAPHRPDCEFYMKCFLEPVQETGA